MKNSFTHCEKITDFKNIMSLKYNDPLKAKNRKVKSASVGQRNAGF